LAIFLFPSLPSFFSISCYCSSNLRHVNGTSLRCPDLSLSSYSLSTEEQVYSLPLLHHDPFLQIPPPSETVVVNFFHAGFLSHIQSLSFFPQAARCEFAKPPLLPNPSQLPHPFLVQLSSFSYAYHPILFEQLSVMPDFLSPSLSIFRSSQTLFLPSLWISAPAVGASFSLSLPSSGSSSIAFKLLLLAFLSLPHEYVNLRRTIERSLPPPSV